VITILYLLLLFLLLKLYLIMIRIIIVIPDSPLTAVPLTAVPAHVPLTAQPMTEGTTWTSRLRGVEATSFCRRVLKPGADFYFKNQAGRLDGFMLASDSDCPESSANLLARCGSSCLLHSLVGGAGVYTI
jgi:hypothetical protein